MRTLDAALSGAINEGIKLEGELQKAQFVIAQQFALLQGVVAAQTLEEVQKILAGSPELQRALVAVKK